MHGVGIMPIGQLLSHLWRRPKASTLLGIGPMSPLIIEASLDLAEEHHFPVMFIASRNQVDIDDYGGGYVSRWDQERFAHDIARVAHRTGFAGIYYLCRDHGGPWQRDEEYKAALDEREALERAKASYVADLKAGFDILHIDPTKDPHRESLPLELVMERTVELIEYVERKKLELGIERQIGYEVGTEETKGGYINPGVFKGFLKELIGRLAQKGLPEPDFIVGQTGTLVRMGTNVGEVDINLAGTLAAIAKDYAVGFKEHNADYLSNEQLELHPRVGITAANVAPEFGHIQTRAYLAEYQREMELVGKKSSSDFYGILVSEVLASGRWQKWLVPEHGGSTIESLQEDPAKLRQIIEACGHYVFDRPVIIEAINQMYANQAKSGDYHGPDRVYERVKSGIERYVLHLNLSGVLDKGLPGELPSYTGA